MTTILTTRIPGFYATSIGDRFCATFTRCWSLTIEDGKLQANPVEELPSEARLASPALDLETAHRWRMAVAEAIDATN